ncbi:mechanosensitive ion channel family protein [Hamadaea tsunoensis]|uniref:mechanosensitive ion channel family protein n=1 Tax=Hamadaea tsunoensis TaxID=53368 RepID=UPI0007E8D003|nr:mechanosensitive ion channel domain-containing protein [Hamadaea tsunoensis]
MHSVWWTAVAAAGAAVLALIAVSIVHSAVARLGRRSVVPAEIAAHAHRPFQIVAVLLAFRLTLRISPVPVADGLLHFLGIALIVSAAWLIAAILIALEDAAESRYRIDVPDNRQARRIRTQVVMLRRVTIAAIVVVTLGLILMTFPEVRAVGASLLASAGVIGIVAALAAQSVLGNVIAGLQIAFSDAIRLDDVVVVEGEWARVEEITLSHVVLQIWDDRRLIMPTSYFTTKPYQNWTRQKSEVLGTVELDVDFAADVQALREELRHVVEAADLWDQRVCVLQVTDAVEGRVHLRALVSAPDAPRLWDLRCLVREHLVGWIRDHQPTAFPRTRAELATADATRNFGWTATRPVPHRPMSFEEGDDRVFSGSVDGEARAQQFTGPDPSLQSVVLAEQALLDEPADEADHDGEATDESTMHGLS